MMVPMKILQTTIDAAFADHDQLSPSNTPNEIRHAIQEVVSLLDNGKLRVAEKINQQWRPSTNMPVVPVRVRELGEERIHAS